MVKILRSAVLLLAAWMPTALTQDSNSDVSAITLRTHSLSSPFLDSELHNRWWNFGGSTVVRADQYVRLTATQPSQSGYIFSRVPLTATNWEVEVEFKIHGTGSLWGDGMAMWVTRESGEQGPVFGMKDKFEGLGIFIDTYKNNRPGVVFPYVMAMSGDGQTAYDKDNDGKANELGGCSARGLRNADIPTKMRVKYFQGAELTVDLMYKKEDVWTHCFQVKDVKIPTVAYLGFTAETGELSDRHDIIKVDTKNLYSKSGSTGESSGPTGSKDYKQAEYKKQKAASASKTSWWTTLLQVLILVLVVAAAYVGYTIYRTQRKDRF